MEHKVVKKTEVKVEEAKSKKDRELQEPKMSSEAELRNIVKPLVNWYRENKRDLPWRHNPDAYRVWVSEIMLQQTRVEAVKGYYDRFLKALPTVKDLAEAEEDKLLKLWEGLGYYNRVRNMQKAAQQIMVDHAGRFPDTYEEILQLKGIGNYTAGAISAFAYGIPKPAVDGNVLRVISRITGSYEDIMKQSVRKKIESALEQVIPTDAASDFNQGLIELGAIVCVPNGGPKCEQCPVKEYCIAHAENLTAEIPVKKKAKARKIEERTILIFKDGKRIAIRKRPAKGLLAGLYEFPNVEGHLRTEEVIGYAQTAGLTPVRVKRIGTAKHIFSHVEWHMTGYELLVDELEKTSAPNVGQMCVENGADGSENIFVKIKQLEEEYAMPSAFDKFVEHTRFS